jgi:hypothetical protein
VSQTLVADCFFRVVYTGADELLMSLNKRKADWMSTHKKAVHLGKKAATSKLQATFGNVLDLNDEKQVAQAATVLSLTSKNGSCPLSNSQPAN